MLIIGCCGCTPNRNWIKGRWFILSLGWYFPKALVGYVSLLGRHLDIFCWICEINAIVLFDSSFSLRHYLIILRRCLFSDNTLPGWFVFFGSHSSLPLYFCYICFTCFIWFICFIWCGMNHNAIHKVISKCFHFAKRRLLSTCFAQLIESMWLRRANYVRYYFLRHCKFITARACVLS